MTTIDTLTSALHNATELNQLRQLLVNGAIEREKKNVSTNSGTEGYLDIYALGLSRLVVDNQAAITSPLSDVSQMLLNAIQLTFLTTDPLALTVELATETPAETVSKARDRLDEMLRIDQQYRELTGETDFAVFFRGLDFLLEHNEINEQQHQRLTDGYVLQVLLDTQNGFYCVPRIATDKASAVLEFHVLSQRHFFLAVEITPTAAEQHDQLAADEPGRIYLNQAQLEAQPMQLAGLLAAHLSQAMYSGMKESIILQD